MSESHLLHIQVLGVRALGLILGAALLFSELGLERMEDVGSSVSWLRIQPGLHVWIAKAMWAERALTLAGKAWVCLNAKVTVPLTLYLVKSLRASVYSVMKF